MPRKKPATRKKPVSKLGFRQVETALRKYALGFPEAYEEFPWGERVIKVNKRIFVFMHGSTQELRVTTKLPQSYGAALLAPFSKPTGYGLGRSGWVTATFHKGDIPPADILRSWIDESYRAIAPKKFAKKLGE